MSKCIELELSTHYFEKDRENELEARIARFELEIGDTLRFCETDADGKRTGRFYDKKIVKLHTIKNAIRYWDLEALKEKGLYLFELENMG